MATQLHILPRLSIIGSPTLPQMLSWRVQTALPFRYVKYRVPLSQCFSTCGSLSCSEWIAEKKLPACPHHGLNTAVTSVLKAAHLASAVTCGTILAISA